ncbi:MAG: RNA 3'-terminal phosphate cyclase [Candidatus Sericytochromatia bacterium]
MSTATEPLRIDGSHGEGGGQIIRTALSLSALTGRPLELINIRAGRPKPGLQAQHLTSVLAAAQVCDAALDGAHVGSTALWFRPGSAAESRDCRFDIGTAGATTLVAQTLLPVMLNHTAKVTLTGGTHVPFAPSADYLARVFLPTIRPLGVTAEAIVEASGFYPRGGGTLVLRTEAGTLSPGEWVERGKLKHLTAVITTSNLPDHVYERGAAAIDHAMKKLGRTVRFDRQTPDGLQSGAAVLLVAECEGAIAGFGAIGERGKPMEAVCDKAVKAFVRWWKSGAALDEHLADQLVLPMALAGGESRWTTEAVTEHLRTVCWLVPQFLPVEATVEEREDGTGLVTIRGK